MEYMSYFNFFCIKRCSCCKFHKTCVPCRQEIQTSVITKPGMIFFFHLFNIQLFFCEKEISKIAGHSQNGSKMTFLRGGGDGFGYFSFIFSSFIFIQNHPCKARAKKLLRYMRGILRNIMLSIPPCCICLYL